MTRTEFLNCYERDELEQELDNVEDLSDDHSADLAYDDDEFIKQTFYPDEY
jgi:hypothetical protein